LYPFNLKFIVTDEYIILTEGAEGEYREKGSKFIGYSFIMNELEELDELIAPLRKLHPKARHFCYAYRLSPKSDLHRANDDGEPRGTAGLPIFNQIQSKECFNTLVVVVRYFGGTKLGAAGLIRAYKAAAEDALQNSEFKVKYDSVACDITYDYRYSGNLLDLLKSLEIEIIEHSYGLPPKMTVLLRHSIYEHQIKQIKSYMLSRPIEDITDETEVDDLSFDCKAEEVI